VVPLKPPKNDGDSGVWSLYDEIPVEKRVKMVENWNKNERKIITKQLSTMDISPKGSTSKTLKVKLYAQEESNWCAAATGQMIAKYHGHTHSQSLVALFMGLEPGTGGGATISDQLNYYHYGISKYGSDDHAASFSGAKGEINANRPLVSRIPGHARCAKGYYDSSIIGDWLLINDPWPEDIGITYWELWNIREHDKDIYVED
jgi:hypothetical protein